MASTTSAGVTTIGSLWMVSPGAAARLAAVSRSSWLGFTTACCIRLSRSGKFALANAGHIAPYVAGCELKTPPAIPLGLIADQTYELVHGCLPVGERLVMLSDGVPEARSQTGELYGFDRLSGLTLLSAGEIAKVAQSFGQEDDITVFTLALGDC